MTDAKILVIAAKAGITRSQISPLHRRLIVAAIDSTKPADKPKKAKASIRSIPNYQFWGVTE